MATADGGGEPRDPVLRPRRPQASMAASEHYGEGSGYLDAMTAKQVDLGQKSGLQKKEPKRRRVTRARRGAR